MEEEDHDELLQCTDDESMSDSDDQCLTNDKPEESQKLTLNSHTTFQLIFLKILVIFSSTALVILLPLYLETNDVKGSAYTILLFISLASLLIFFFALLLSKIWCQKYKFVSVWKPPLRWSETLKLSLVYAVCGFLIIYALYQKKVMCHLQDPIKGIIVVFSLIFYFFFCTKLMGLQRIFSTTTIIVGLFISVDYGLCDEFRCRGYEKQFKTDDSGPWTWQVHAVWSGLYILGLALFAAFYTLLDKYAIPVEIAPIQTTVTTSLLTTISRLVSFQNSNQLYSQETRPLSFTQRNRGQICFIHLGFWIHLMTFVFILGTFWLDFVPYVGTVDGFATFLNRTTNGLFCHLTPYLHSKAEHHAQCGNVSLYAWLFLVSYLIYTLSTIQFLIITQSAVYTVATTAISLPLAGIWWSVFHMVPLENGLLIWSPSVTGELICALLGLPIVLIGLIMLCKSHLKDIQLLKTNSQPAAQFA